MENGDTTKQMRMARAGLDIIKGTPTKHALIAAGYSPETARKPKANGLSASRCVEATAIEFPEAAPTKLLQAARRAMAGKLSSWINHPANLTKAKGGEVARMYDVVERWCGSHEPDDPSTRRFDHRLAAFADAVEEAKRRGLLDDKGRLTGRRTLEVEAKPSCD